MKEFTEFDKELARNIYGRYKWIARNAIGDLYVFASKPYKGAYMWDCQHDDTDMVHLPIYGVFEAVRWNDNEPTLIRSIYDYDSQILNNEEKEYLKAVFKPFHNRVMNVTKSSGGIGVEFIAVELMGDVNTFRLPCFKEGEKYVRMTRECPYTLRELGITYD